MGAKPTSELCFFCCLGPSTPVLPTPLSTQCLPRPQREPTQLIPLKVCLRRPNARIKRRHNVYFCLRRHTSVLLFGRLETELLPTRPQFHSHFLQHERPGSKAPIDILQPHPCAAAAPATRSQSAH